MTDFVVDEDDVDEGVPFHMTSLELLLQEQQFPLVISIKPDIPNLGKLSSNGKRVKVPFHVALTATDAAYSQWQCRIMYYWYKEQRDLPGSDFGGFTRILHSGKEDDLMDEIPTFVADPLPSGLDRGYVVLNRPWVFVQWLAKAEIDEE